MKSFAVKRDANDPRWSKFIEWGNDKFGECYEGNIGLWYYGLEKTGRWSCCPSTNLFDRILTLDEWEREFINPQPQLAGREYDLKLLEDFKEHFCDLKTVDQYRYGTVKKYYLFEESYLKDIVDARYAKTDRISEIKAEIERLKKELKEIEI